MKLSHRIPGLIPLLLVAMAMPADLLATTTYLPTDVVEVPTISDLRTITVSGANPTVVNVRGHTTDGDGGGGLFRRNGQSCGDDDGVIVQQGNSYNNWCWYRQFNGPVHLSWYGVPDAAGNIPGTSTPCYNDDSLATGFQACAADNLLGTDGSYHNAVLRAFNAAAPSAGLGGDGGVVTDGRSIVIVGGLPANPTNMHIPPNQYFSCSGPPGGRRVQQVPGSIPYYTLPNSIVLLQKGPNSSVAYSIWRDSDSLLASCIIRPTWYNEDTLSHVSDTRSLIDKIEHLFTGTATICGTNPNNGSPTDGEACNMRDVLILGFDVGDDTRNSANAVISNVKCDCNVGEFIHEQGGGLKLENGDVHPFIESGMSGSGGDISHAVWPIKSIANVSGQVQLTLFDATNNIVDGDTLIVSGIGTTPGSGPVAQNARWILQCSPTPCGTSFNLLGSSWTGPTYAGSSWLQNSSVITVTDTTDIAGGEYVCAPPLLAIPPFCTPPSGFVATATTISSGSSIGGHSSDLPRVEVGSTAGWPQSGLVCIPSTSCTTSGSEYLGYRIVDATHIQITSRGGDNTTITSHASPDPLAPSAPSVIAPVPSANRVVVNATATSGSTGTVQFANDLFVPPPR